MSHQQALFFHHRAACSDCFRDGIFHCRSNDHVSSRGAIRMDGARKPTTMQMLSLL
jgi:hypothetical protein